MSVAGKSEVIVADEQLPASVPSPTHELMITPEMLTAAIAAGEQGREAFRMMLDAQREERAEWARRQYNGRLAAFQADCPPVTRRKGIPDNSGRIKYRYAPLEDIVMLARPHLQAHGFGFSFDVSYPDGRTRVTCTMRHADGHQETASQEMPGVQVPKANAAQNEGAAVTYAKRLAFLSVTGIVTADEDTDAVEPVFVEPVTEHQAADLRALWDEVMGADHPCETFFGLVGKRAGVQFDTWAAFPASQYDFGVQQIERKR